MPVLYTFSSVNGNAIKMCFKFTLYFKISLRLGNEIIAVSLLMRLQRRERCFRSYAKQLFYRSTVEQSGGDRKVDTWAVGLQWDSLVVTERWTHGL
jgi:hypothetical protein